MNNVILKTAGVETADLLKPITNIIFIMKSGVQIEVQTPLSVEDFTLLYKNKLKHRIKIITGANSYAEFKKRHVDFYQVYPILG